MWPQANRYGSALSFSYHETCPDCAGSCSCHYGDLEFSNSDLATISCSLASQPRVVPLRGCWIHNPGEAAANCDKLADKEWEDDSDTVKPGKIT